MNIWYILPTIYPHRALPLIAEIRSNSNGKIAITTNTPALAEKFSGLVDLLVVGVYERLSTATNVVVDKIGEFDFVYWIGDDCWPIARDIDEQIATSINGVTYFFDGLNKETATHPVISYDCYKNKRKGYFYNEKYYCLGCDADLTKWAKTNGCYEFRNKILFEHRHWTTGKTKREANADVANSTLPKDQETYRSIWGEDLP